MYKENKRLGAMTVVLLPARRPTNPTCTHLTRNRQIWDAAAEATGILIRMGARCTLHKSVRAIWEAQGCYALHGARINAAWVW